MKLSLSALLVALSLATAAPVAELEKRATTPGFDISHYQATVNFKAAYNSGARFVIIKVIISISCPPPPTSLSPSTIDFLTPFTCHQQQ